MERSDVLTRELGDVVEYFEAWLAKELAVINAGLAKKQLEQIKPLTREEWEKQSEQK